MGQNNSKNKQSSSQLDLKDSQNSQISKSQVIIQKKSQQENQFDKKISSQYQEEDEINDKLKLSSSLDFLKIKKYKQNLSQENILNPKKMKKYQKHVITIGPTGSGKTTYINFLLGNKIGYVNAKFNNEKSLVSEKQQNEDQKIFNQIYSSSSKSDDELNLSKGLDEQISSCQNNQIQNQLGVINQVVKAGKIGHNYAESCTSQIQVNYDKKHKHVLIDTAGFQDSRGSELEIINKLQLIDVLKNAQQLKILIFIDYRSIGTHKGKLYKEITQIINSLFNTTQIEDFKEFYSTHCLFFISHCNENESIETIQLQLKDLQQYLKQQSDAQGLQLTKAIINGFQNIENKQQYSFIAKPQSDNLDEIWKNIEKCNSIKNPYDYIKLDLSDDLKSKFEKYLQCNENLYNEYFENEQLSKLIIVSQNILYLYELTKLIQTKTTFQNIINKVKNKKNQFTNDLIQYLKDQFSNYNKQKIQDIDNFYQQNIKDKQKDPKYMKLFQNLFGVFKENEIETVELYRNKFKFINKIENQLIQMQTKFDIQDNQSQQMDFIYQFLQQLFEEKKIIVFPNNIFQKTVIFICLLLDFLQLNQTVSKIFEEHINHINIIINNELIQQISELVIEGITLIQISDKDLDFKKYRIENINDTNQQKIKNLEYYNLELEKLKVILEINKLSDHHSKINKIYQNFLQEFENFVKKIEDQIKQGIFQFQQFKELENSDFYNKLLVNFSCLKNIGKCFKNYSNKFDIQQEKLQKFIEATQNDLQSVLKINSEIQINSSKDYQNKIKLLKKLQQIYFEVFNINLDCCHQIEEQIKVQIQLYSEQLQNQIDQNKDILYDEDTLVEKFKQLLNYQWIDDIYQVQYSKIAVSKVLQFIVEQIYIIQQKIDQIVKSKKIDLEQLVTQYLKGIKYKKLLEIQQQCKDQKNYNMNMVQEDLDIINKQIQKMDNILNDKMKNTNEQQKILQSIVNQKQNSNFDWENLIQQFENLKLYINLPKYGDNFKQTVQQFEQYMASVIYNNYLILDDICKQSQQSFLDQISQLQENLPLQISTALRNIKRYQQSCKSLDKQHLFQFKLIKTNQVVSIFKNSQNHINFELLNEPYQNIRNKFIAFFKSQVRHYENSIEEIQQTDILCNANQIQILYTLLEQIGLNTQDICEDLKLIMDQQKSIQPILCNKIKTLRDIIQTGNTSQIGQKLLEFKEIMKDCKFNKQKQSLVQFITYVYKEKSENIIFLIEEYNYDKINIQQIYQSIKELQKFEQLILEHFDKNSDFNQVQLNKKINQVIRNYFKDELKNYFIKLINSFKFDILEEQIEQLQKFLTNISKYENYSQIKNDGQPIIDYYQDADKIIQHYEYMDEESLIENYAQIVKNINLIINSKQNKYIKIKEWLGQNLNRIFTKKYQNYIKQQGQKKQDIMQVKILKDYMDKFNKIFPNLSINYMPYFNQYNFDKEQILQKIQQINTITDRRQRSSLVLYILNNLNKIEKQVGLEYPIYTETQQAIKNLVSSTKSQIINVLEKQQLKKQKDITDLIEQIEILEDLEPLSKFTEGNFQSLQLNILPIVQKFYEKIENLIQQQINNLQIKMDGIEKNFTKIKNIDIKENQSVGTSDKDNIKIDLDCFIIWHKSLLLQYYILQQKNQQQQKQLQKRTILSLQDKIQQLFDQIQNAFENNIIKFFQLLKLLQDIEKFFKNMDDTPFDRFKNFIEENSDITINEQYPQNDQLLYNTNKQNIPSELKKYLGIQLFQYPIFDKLRLQLYQLKYNSKSPKDVIQDFKLYIDNKEQKELDKDYLYENYKKLTNMFINTRDKYLNKEKIQQYKEIAIEAHDIAKNIKKIHNPITLNTSNTDLVLNLLSKIFSVWSLQDIKINDLSDKNVVYISPNVNQIFSIMMILNCHQKQNNILSQILGFFKGDNHKQLNQQIMNHVQQIGTGEGKSVIIGVLSVFFAILGFNVHSVCYSQYLSERDEKAFYKLFECFQIQDKIFYGTFQTLCKKVLEQNIKLQDATLNLLQNNGKKDCTKQVKEKQFTKNTPTILICDEIDVFFSQDFFGKTYKQIVQLQSPEITGLIKYIWQQGKWRPNQQSQSWESIYNNTQQQNFFKNIMKKYSQFQQIIEQEIMKICFQVTLFKDHKNYFVENQKIGYKMADHTKNFEITHDYLTQFAYLKSNEEDEDEMPMDSVEKALSINIVSGRVSYAEVPLKYQYIFGVTGTYEGLEQEMKKILQNKYQIRNYLNSNYLAFPKEEYNIINERTENKDDQIRLATLSQKVSLLTKDYGRGTDFSCNSEEVQKNGGVVVIQTFFSDDPSEETQIKGRTARQGENGSYHIYLEQQKLQDQFDLDQATIENFKNQGDGYQKLSELRIKKLKTKIKNLQNNLKACFEKSQQTQNYIECLEKNQQDKARDFLLQLNKDTIGIYKKESKEQHIIFLLDSSASMGGKPWQDLMSAFENCIQIKQQSNQNHIVSIIYYESRAHLICNQEKITNVINIIRKTSRKSGGTNFSSAFDECYKLLDSEKEKHKNYSKIIMFMTDGQANDNFMNSIQKLQQKYGKIIQKFQCQGFGQFVNTQVLKYIAQLFGLNGVYSQAIEQEQLAQQMIQFADIEVGHIG
ncbi:P-loop containing nucleoside triphosphate hydrolase [Pseudocohnilembus persalinus]|uniref:p-loop containing nucleoside triphosphate hydrolase n=1 Tax=Pseudocohnilembus persalinus TaxID=266149 RepID=A0A0V0QQJ2_PSEPJ|nr:P-loop containing nucleoside triphosphate hydrolase [Pseudocohnilembus persalinus]|eukprot:KRX04481.1 P-loop containing nucleoside triphosphate hydrolase [Pseudocohnilembus persalinus]